MIEFKNVFKAYKGNEVISDVSFEIKTGEFVVIIGASGCGKTTTLKMINRLIDPTAGQILIDGEDISKKDLIKMRRKMGYVIQQTGLFPHMSIKDNIEIIPKVEKYEKADIRKKTYELMEMVGLDCDEFLDRYPAELSGGQQQRVGVARAFATDPDVILMDEPLSALDPITRIGLQNELVELQRKLKKTIVFVTHDMDEAIKIADRICIMDKGHIVQYDTPENILKHPANEFVSEFVGRKRIWASPQFIKARDIMEEDIITANSSLSLFKGMEIMRSVKDDALMIVESKTGKLQGVLYAQSIPFDLDRALPIAQAMETDYFSAHPDETILQVLKAVMKNDIPSVPVIDEEDKLLGVITKSTLITTLSQQYMKEEV
ncbi:betaine/proline/choline family ABC transporter ATP-binding protein [Ohessyouella blattaphilus]|uniref:Quaternary amine transport ATP-binding protein n=1 Tax=Ohessyouella blattaphilus TaxID=2949333 RepID=A0ABT1EKE8_9FIRM|nr:ABC transporter ATP-binding protein [Ohessyouella blattaphilus]MCP1109787.1 ABC transporter ATP-binding protein [Ohessyouella blattaphilus]MCR8563181.1 ABC transporter ATP-binding protein [Ohessyouella blattaphilus]